VSGDRPNAVVTLLAALPAAIEFLTPARVHFGRELPEAAVGSSSAFFPVVGLLLGLVLIGVDRLLGRVIPALALNAMLLIVLSAGSGLLHLDGLADTADGLLGGATPERSLEIMRDSRIGAFGAAAIALTLLLQWTLLADLVAPWRRPALLLFPVLGRSAMVAAIAAFPYARRQGLGTVFRRYVWPWSAPVALVLALILSVLCFGGSGVALWGIMLLTAIAAGGYLTSRIGGLTGDTYGAICELTQVLVLLAIVSAHSSGWLLPWLIHG
jgi:adenosylcobinamide-GDP ribazoletransferase